MFLFLAIALVLAPLGEEIIFRGYFYRVLSVFKGQGWAIVIVAVLFGLFMLSNTGDWLARWWRCWVLFNVFRA